MSRGIRSTRDLKPGDLYTTDGRDVWEVLYFCDQPTVTMKNVRTNEERGGAVGCPNLQKFVRLVPEASEGEGEKT